jgi:hypothetical protein
VGPEKDLFERISVAKDLFRRPRSDLFFGDRNVMVTILGLLSFGLTHNTETLSVLSEVRRRNQQTSPLNPTKDWPRNPFLGRDESTASLFVIFSDRTVRWSAALE